MSAQNANTKVVVRLVALIVFMGAGAWAADAVL